MKKKRTYPYRCQRCDVQIADAAASREHSLLHWRLDNGLPHRRRKPRGRLVEEAQDLTITMVAPSARVGHRNAAGRMAELAASESVGGRCIYQASTAEAHGLYAFLGYADGHCVGLLVASADADASQLTWPGYTAIGCSRSEGDQEPDRCLVWFTWVAVAHRSQGIGTKMVRAAAGVLGRAPDQIGRNVRLNEDGELVVRPFRPETIRSGKARRRDAP